MELKLGTLGEGEHCLCFTAKNVLKITGDKDIVRIYLDKELRDKINKEWFNEVL